MVIVFYILLASELLVEGLALPGGHNFAFIVSLFLSTFVIVSHFYKRLKFPKVITTIYVLFLCISIASALISSDFIKSFQTLAIHISCFLVLVYTYNNQSEIKRFLIYFIFLTGIIFCLWSLLLNLSVLSPIFYPDNGYQLVYSYTLSHNHLGDFLLLPLTICIYYFLNIKSGPQKNKTTINLLLILFSLPFFLFSYSRSAYLSLAVICLLLTVVKKESFNHNLKKIKIVALTLSLFLVFITIAVSSNSSQFKIFHPIKERLYDIAPFREKVVLGARIEYLYEGLRSIIERPVLGIGPGNFYLASIKYTNFTGTWTQTAHNIFLEIATENGIFAGILFVLFIFYSLRSKKRDLFFYLALVLILNFQTDYTYKLYSVSLLLFVILGVHLTMETIER